MSVFFSFCFLVGLDGEQDTDRLMLANPRD
jgi:hypothetical protein